MAFTADDLVLEVRRALDEVTLSGELVLTDTDMEDVASSNFSDQDIKDRLLDGVRYVVARVKASHVPNFVVDVTPSDISTNAKKILRLLGSRVTVEQTDGTIVEATRRTFSSHRKLEHSGRKASADNPVFIYEDHDLEIDVGGDTVTSAVAKGVRVPDSEADIPKIGDKFRAAVVQYAVASCFQTLQLTNNANAAKKAMVNEILPYLLTRVSPRDASNNE